MPTIYNLRAQNNATFRWTRDLSQLALVYNIAGATIRMQARLSAFAPDPPLYEWVSTNSSQGQIQFNAGTNLCVFAAPEEDTAALSGPLVYDCRLEFSGGTSIVIFGGSLVFSEGVTRRSSDLSGAGISGIGDTVTVDGERSTSPTPIPLSLSAAIAAAQGGSVTPTVLAAAMIAMIAGLPTSPVSGTPTLWNNGGSPQYS